MRYTVLILTLCSASLAKPMFEEYFDEAALSTKDHHNISSQRLTFKSAESCVNPYTSLVLGVDEIAFLNTPDFPELYSANTNCGWNIMGPPGTKLVLNCAAVRLPKKDYLKITDGADVVKLTGDYNFNEYEFSSHVGTVALKSDDSKQSRGFTCQVSVKEADTKHCICGAKPLSTRTVGGTEAASNANPWMVNLQQTYGPLCGGTLVSDRWFLTAAHCITSAAFLVFLGDEARIHSLGNKYPVRLRAAQQVVIHPDYTGDSRKEHDLALVKIDPIVWEANPLIRPACLPLDNTDTYAGDMATVAGWGKLSKYGSPPNTLHQASFPVLSNTECQTVLSYKTITSNMLCGGSLAGGVGVCDGDEGSPLLVEDGDNCVLGGVASYVEQCAIANNPAVFTRVAEYLQWIHTTIGTTGLCPRA